MVMYSWRDVIDPHILNLCTRSSSLVSLYLWPFTCRVKPRYGLVGGQVGPWVSGLYSIVMKKKIDFEIFRVNLRYLLVEHTSDIHIRHSAFPLSSRMLHRQPFTWSTPMNLKPLAMYWHHNHTECAHCQLKDSWSYTDVTKPTMCQSHDVT